MNELEREIKFEKLYEERAYLYLLERAIEEDGRTDLIDEYENQKEYVNQLKEELEEL